jgi:hypothetical protein
MQKDVETNLFQSMLAPFRAGWRAIRDRDRENAEVGRLKEKFNAIVDEPDKAAQALALIALRDENALAAEKQRDILPKMLLSPILGALAGSLAAGIVFASLAPFLVWGLLTVVALGAATGFQNSDASMRAHKTLDLDVRAGLGLIVTPWNFRELKASPRYAALAGHFNHMSDDVAPGYEDPNKRLRQTAPAAPDFKAGSI